MNKKRREPFACERFPNLISKQKLSPVCPASERLLIYWVEAPACSNKDFTDRSYSVGDIPVFNLKIREK